MSEPTSTTKPSQESSKKKADSLFNQGFEGLAKVTPMAPDQTPKEQPKPAQSSK